MADERRSLLDASDVQRGLTEVGATLAAGRPGFFIGRGLTGGAVLVVGATAIGVVPAGNGGAMLAIGLNAEGLAMLIERACSLAIDAEPKPGAVPL